VHRDNEYTERQDGKSLHASACSPAPLNPALRLAALHGVASSVRLHIERKDSLDGRDPNGQTALMIAARRNHLEVCTLLLQAGVDPNLLDKDGLTALDLAEKAGATSTCTKLVEFNLNRIPLLPKSEVTWLPRDPAESIQESNLLPKTGIAVTRDATEDDTALDDWEPLTASEPPEDDTDLRDRATQTQAAIDEHIPIDPLAISWDEVSAYLPKEFHSGAFSEVLEQGIREIFLRSLGEGSVPARQMDSLLEGEDPLNATNIKRLATQVMNDLGAELDERIEATGVLEDHRVWPTGEATDEDRRMLDEAIEHLASLLQPKNDPGQLFAKMAYGLPLLTQAEEVEIAREMEKALESAHDILSRWPEGLCVLLQKCTDVEAGNLALKEVQGRNTAIEVHHNDDTGGEAQSPQSKPSRQSSTSYADDDETDLAEPQSVDELEEFLSQVDVLRKLTALSKGHPPLTSKVRAVLDAMHLSGTLLCSLEQRNSKQPEAIEFTRYISIFLKARDHLILSNLKLVVPMAKRFLGTGADLSDLLQEGHIGLIRAADKFDWRRGFKFATMATWWIRQQISRAAPEQARLIRLPVHGVEVTWEMKRLIRTHLDQYDQPPSIRWIAHQLGLSELKTESYLRTISEPLPLEVMESSPWLPIQEYTDPLEHASRLECADRAEGLLQHLGSTPGKKMSEKVLRMRYGIGTWEDLTLDEIGRRFGLTRERIRQIEAKALRKLRHPSRSDKLKSFLDTL
jgi:RNA polymerase primary sigma factor